MSNSNPINLTPQGPPSTVLPFEDRAIRDALDQALNAPVDEHLAKFAEVAMRHPRSLLVWAHLGDSGRDILERYAYYRIGYHRGLDTLRQNGWRGSGYVRWQQESNRGFLRCLAGLHQMATVIGETDEAMRCAVFLLQLDPSGMPHFDG